MCGITGIMNQRLSREALITRVNAMTSTLVHRGPDGEGIWVDENSGIALGHRRLAIVDLSETGNQPMVSSSNNFVITFNGEIYNYKSIREQLSSRGVSFKGASDTEVFLSAIDEYGLDGALSVVLGMFAFALVDRRNDSLILGRDRIGEKPLYFAKFENEFIFGSELKALRQSKNWKREINRESLAQLVRYGFIPSPATIFEQVKKLSAGSLLFVTSNNSNLFIEEKRWWDYQKMAVSTPTPSKCKSISDASSYFSRTFQQVISEQSSADVSVGTLLSGGIDSSVVTAAASLSSSLPIKTFTIGYKEHLYDESADAERIANHLGTEHYSKFVTEDEVLSLIENLPEIYDEPIGDYSQIPTALIAKFAKRKVKVALTGDGGDEVFSGYNRYIWGPIIGSVKQFLPSFLQQIVGNQLVPETRLNWDEISRVIPERYRPRLPHEKLGKIASILQTTNNREAYLSLLSCWQPPIPVLKAKSSDLTQEFAALWKANLPFSEKMRHMDALTYLPDDILVKVDRASMACSLETRAPLLDPRIISFAHQLPLPFKQKGLKGKLLLRHWLGQHIPKSLFDRPKAGFSFPLANWLRGPLYPWASTLLSPDRLLEEGYFEAGIVDEIWKAHLAMKANYHELLWPILMFQAWNNK